MKEGDKAHLLLLLLLFLCVFVPLCFTHSYRPVKEPDRASAVGMVEETRFFRNRVFDAKYFVQTLNKGKKTRFL
jgi:hypothetical protein